jgi:hypothetical protein
MYKQIWPVFLTDNACVQTLSEFTDYEIGLLDDNDLDIITSLVTSDGNGLLYGLAALLTALI